MPLVPLFLHLKNGHNNDAYLLGLWWGLTELTPHELS